MLESESFDLAIDEAVRSGEITRLLSKLSQGDPVAEQQVFELLYQDLRRLASSYLSSERPDHTLQATALVHEAYLRISKTPGQEWQNRNHFIAVAAKAMRRILVDHARNRKAAKRGSVKISLESALIGAAEQPSDLVALHEALERLSVLDPRQAQIVELRFFGGLEGDEIATVLGVSQRTVKRDWAMARAWLFGELNRAIEGAER